MTESYDFLGIETRRQAAWSASEAYAAPGPQDTRRPVYVKASSPFTSGAIHVGHVRSYSIADVYARFSRARGDAVLFTLGFDSFGLPAEMAAHKAGVAPGDWVHSSTAAMVAQLRRLGFSFAWDRTFRTSDPAVYRWSQWLFLRFLEAGLVHRSEAVVDWCPRCETTLAVLQAQHGRCWRCDTQTEVRRRPQWFARLSGYVAENEANAATLGWDDASVASQRTLARRLEGYEMTARGSDGRELRVFSARTPGAAVAFVAMSPRHEALDVWLAAADRGRVALIADVGLRRESRSARTAPVIDTGVRVVLNGLSRSVPVLVSPLVDYRCGTVAVLGEPERDRSDAIVAERLGLLAAPWESVPDICELPRTASHRSHDFTISRQRSWGTPIPIVHCERCGAVPVDAGELPVRLPPGLRPDLPNGSLGERADFRNTSCPRCDRAALRETETLDGHFDALWIWVPACVPRHARADAMFQHPEVRRWLPGRMQVFGADGGAYAFDQRIVAKALRDIGVLPHLVDGEPFAGAAMHGMVTLQGRKMSKHLGNVVDPDELRERYGADALRLAMLSAARPARSFTWDDGGIVWWHRFLGRLWTMAQVELEPRNPPHARRRDEYDERWLAERCGRALDSVEGDLACLRLHRALARCVTLFSDIERFRVSSHGVGSRQRRLRASLLLLAQMLAPMAPHVSEEMWLLAGETSRSGGLPWPAKEGDRSSG